MKLGLILSKPPGVSETFLRAHVDRLSEQRVVLAGRHPDYRLADGTLAIPPPAMDLLSRAGRKVRRKFFGESKEDAVAEWISRQGMDVLLAEFGHIGAAIAPSCESAGVPLVVHFHGLDASNHKILEKFAEPYQRMFQSAAAIVAVSRAMKAKLISLGAPEEKIALNYYGVDFDRFNATDPAANPPTLVGVGRFVEKKAPHLTILAFAKIADQFPEARLILAGDGALYGPCQAMIDAVGLKDRIEFPGSVSHDQVASLMAGARAFVQHSIVASDGDSEGTPVAILEAGAAGLPVIATRHAGIPDVVIENETGLLVDEFDVETMAEHMGTLLRDPGEASRLGARARSYIQSNHTMDKSLSGLREILTSAASRIDRS